MFSQTFLQFSDRMVGGGRIPNGQARIKQHAALFAKVEEKYGVPAPVLVAFWGLESDFGANFGNYKILSAIATLAYDCRRPEFFRTQLFDALRIIERGDQRVEDMIGDWAGEFGGLQFTASDYLKNAVDFDGDGRRDLIHSIPDTMASGANFLNSLGWQRGQPWLQEVSVPANLPWDQADLTIQHPVSQWAAWGMKAGARRAAGGRLPASMILPMGRFGPGVPGLSELQGLPRLEFGLRLFHHGRLPGRMERAAGAPPAVARAAAAGAGPAADGGVNEGRPAGRERSGMKRALQPTSSLGWWSFWLSFATITWGRLFPLLVGLLAPRLRSVESPFPVPIGFTGAALELVLALAAFGVGVAAIRKGQRSWMVLVALAVAVLVGGFWLVFALGEVLWPH